VSQPIDIRPEHLAIVQKILRDVLPRDAKIWVFGSRAKWTTKDSSDLDLAIDAGRQLTRKEEAALAEMFDDSDLPYKVDVVDMHSVSDSFRQIIERDKVALPMEEKQAGGLPEGWREVKLGESLTFRNGKTSPDRLQDAKIPVFGSNGIIGFAHESNTTAKSIVIGRVGSFCGSVYFSKNPAWVTDNAIVGEAKKDQCPEFFYYFLTGRNLNSLQAGSGQPLINQSILSSIDFYCPPLPEQKAIAAILGALDDKIETNRKMNATLEGIARALFKSWFVDFDPVRAKAEGRSSGLPVDFDALFPDSFIDSPLGEIPMGWRLGKLKDIATPKKQTVNPADYPQDNFLHYSLPAFDNGRMPILEKGTDIKSNKTMISKHDVLLSKLNPEIERVWLPFSEDQYTVCSTEFLSYRANEPFCREYLYCLFKARSFRNLLKGMVTGTSKSHQRAQPTAILELDCLLPKNLLLTAFQKQASVLFSKTNTVSQQNQTLATLRDTLLPKLISGQIRVGDAENIMEKAL
jgi:type I restriction enzyme S subunit